MCEIANQQYIWSHMVVYMVSKMRCRSLTFRRCFVSRVRYPEIGHFEVQNRLDIMFVWFAKHRLAKHCLLFRGDADECEKQFCFVFRLCLAFFDSRLRRALDKWNTSSEWSVLNPRTPPFRCKKAMTWRNTSFELDTHLNKGMVTKVNRSGGEVIRNCWLGLGLLISLIQNVER